MGISLAFASANSAAGSEPATIPQPAKSRIWCGSVSLSCPQRRAIAHSPSPLASIQPTGPAYRSRSKCSNSAIRSRASSVGVPHTAAVGCKAAARASEATPLSATAVISVARCRHVGQLQNVGGVRHVHARTERGKRPSDGPDGVLVLLEVLARPGQRGRQIEIMIIISGAADRARQAPVR